MVSWGFMAYYFYTVINSKIKLYNVRKKMKELGFINQKESILFSTLRSLVFWMFPVKYSNSENNEYNVIAKRANKSILNMGLVFVLFILVSYLKTIS